MLGAERPCVVETTDVAAMSTQMLGAQRAILNSRCIGVVRKLISTPVSPPRNLLGYVQCVSP